MATSKDRVKLEYKDTWTLADESFTGDIFIRTKEGKYVALANKDVAPLIAAAGAARAAWAAWAAEAAARAVGTFNIAKLTKILYEMSHNV